MPLANTPVVLNLLDGPVGVIRLFTLSGPGFASCAGTWLTDLIAHVAPGHGPVHLLLTSAAEIGFAWDDDDEQGWIRPEPPLCHFLTD